MRRFRNGERGNGGPRRQSVAPGGFAGQAQQTPATQLVTLASFGVARRAPRRQYTLRQTPRTRADAGSRRRRSPKRSSPKRAHLVKGSAAAKRYMSKLRRMQKRRR